MIKLFQRNMALQAVLILAALVLLWLRPLLECPPMEGGDHPAVFYGLLCDALASLPRLAVILAMVLVLVEGLVLNLLLSNVGLVSQNSLLPTLLYVLACGMGASTLTPMLLVNAALIACLHYLMLHGTLLTIPAGRACGATAMIGLASLFYQPAILFIFSYLLIAASYRLYGWKDWLVMLLGLAAPYAALLLVLYMTDGVAPWWQSMVTCLSQAGIAVGSATVWQTFGSMVMAVALLWGVVYTVGRLTERPVVWQKNATNVVLLLVGGLGMLLYTSLMPFSAAPFAIPFAFCINRMLLGRLDVHTGFGNRRKRGWIADLALCIIIAAAYLC